MQAAEEVVEQPILSEQFKEDKKLKLSSEEIKEQEGNNQKGRLNSETIELKLSSKDIEDEDEEFKKIIKRPIKSGELKEPEDKLNALNRALEKRASYPNNYVFTLLAQRSYRPAEKRYATNFKQQQQQESRECSTIYFCTSVEFTLPTVTAKYPLAHKC